MSNFDHLSLDGRSLYMLRQIYELRSVTETARLLGVTQSSVSHSLDRLRGLFGDPLFIKVGRSMVPTERVEAMMEGIDQVLQGIEDLYSQSDFDPAQSKDRFSIICNDFEHDLLVPEIFTRLKQEAPNSTLRTHQRHMLQTSTQMQWYGGSGIMPLSASGCGRSGCLENMYRPSDHLLRPQCSGGS